MLVLFFFILQRIQYIKYSIFIFKFLEDGNTNLTCLNRLFVRHLCVIAFILYVFYSHLAIKYEHVLQFEYWFFHVKNLQFDSKSKISWDK